MEIKDYLEKMRFIQKSLLDYLDSEKNLEENTQNLFQLLKKQNIHENRFEFYDFIHLLSVLSNNHHRQSNFFEKIEYILKNYKKEIQNYLTNHEIFEVFKENKRIILFLIENNYITIDSFNEIETKIFQNFYSYKSYFYNEIKSFITDEEKKDNEIQNLQIDGKYEENRRIGENEDILCNLIRKDMVKEFIVYVNKNSISLNSYVQPSIFETNHYLLFYNRRLTLIQYSAFFGSSQIFKYLYLNGVELTESICFYAIHGENAEIIHFLEDNGIEHPMHIFHNCIYESIKCHHNDIANYLLRDLEDEKENLKDEHYLKTIQEMNTYPSFDLFQCYSSIPSFKFVNYILFPDNLDDPFNFYHLCKYNHINMVKILLETKNIQINQRIINNNCF